MCALQDPQKVQLVGTFLGGFAFFRAATKAWTEGAIYNYTRGRSTMAMDGSGNARAERLTTDDLLRLSRRLRGGPHTLNQPEWLRPGRAAIGARSLALHSYEAGPRTSDAS